MKTKNESPDPQGSPLHNLFTAHLLLYIVSVTLIFWDMLGWQQFSYNAISDRIIVVGCWGVLLFSHYVYSRLSNTIRMLQHAIQEQRQGVSSSLFLEDSGMIPESEYAQEDAAQRLRQ